MSRREILGTLLGTALLFAPATGQDRPEIAGLVEKLGSDSLTERDEAGRKLEALSPDLADELEKWPTANAEIRARLTAVAQTLRLRAKLAPVLGPTRRVSISADRRSLAEVTAKIGEILGEKILIGTCDADQKVSLELSNATLWQALDALSEVAGARYAYLSDRVELAAGRRPAFPAKHVEQFRVGVVQATRMEAWTPSGQHDHGLALVSVRYQRNLRPVRGFFGEGLRISSMVDAEGDKIEWHPPAGSRLQVGGLQEGPFEILGRTMYIPGTAVLPLTIDGEVDLRFALEDLEIDVPLDTKGTPHREAGCEFEIQDFSNTDAGLEFSIRVEACPVPGQEDDEEGEFDHRLPFDHHLRVETVVVKLRDGSTHRVASTGGANGLFSFRSDTKVHGPASVRFRWNTEFHRVQFPWRLEGLTLPP